MASRKPTRKNPSPPVAGGGPRDRVLELRRVRAGDLRPNPKNWRTHPERQRTALRGVLAEIGYAAALIARELPDGSLELIDGHLRATETPDSLVPVLVVDLGPAEADKLLASLDPLAAMAESDRGRLERLLTDIGPASRAMEGLMAALREQQGLPPAVAAGQTDPDEVPEPPAVPVTRPGDLWRLGEHRLLCGDSTERESYRQLLAGETPVLLVTDPPYGVAYQDAGKSRIQGDLTQAAFPVALSCCVEVLDRDARLYVFCATDQVTMADRVFNHLLGMRPRLVVWKKESFILRHNGYHSQYEMVCYGWKGAGGGPSRWYGDRKQSDVWDIRRDPDRVHPTQKPVDVCAIPVRNSSQVGDAVLEPFNGSGSTLMACEQLGRRCFAIETDAVYVDVAVRRWEAFTGKEATRETAARPARKGRKAPKVTAGA